MNEVLHGVGGVSQLIGQIALASGEQSKWIAQVTLAVVELDRVTQQNATLVQAGVRYGGQPERADCCSERGDHPLYAAGGGR